jgi:hypothetical protein
VKPGGKIYWTIHNHPNHAFSVRVNEECQTALVGFKNPNDAILISKMIEKHYIIQKEWPETQGQIILPSASDTAPLSFLFCKKWDFEDLKLECTKNFLNMITVDNITNTKKGLGFNGNILSFDAPIEFYMIRLEDLLNI